MTGTENNGELKIAASGVGDVLTYGVCNTHLSYKKTRSLYADCTFNFIVSDFKYHESNYNFKDSETGEILYTANSSPSGAEVTYTYLVNGPYIVFDSLELVNPLGTSGEKVTDLKDVYKWKYYGHIGGQPMNVRKYVIAYNLEIRLPSEEYIKSKASEFYKLGEIDSYGLYTQTSVLGWGANYLYDSEKTNVYHLNFKETIEVDKDGNFKLCRDAEHIYSRIVEKYGGYLNFEDYEFDYLYKVLEFSHRFWHGDTQEEDFYSIILPFALSHMHVSQISAVVYAEIDLETGYYGRNVINDFSFGVQDNCVTMEILQDIINTSSEDYWQDVTEKTKVSYDEAIKNAKEMTDNIYLTDNAYSDLSSSDIWDYAKSTASGLVGSLNWIKKLGAVVASVFSFIPGVNENIIVPVFVIGIITAIIAFIRGK